MSLTEALSKLHEILSVLIGESADEWRAQKQSTCFTSEWEWARHLLSIHKTCCTENNCFLAHNEECAAENHTSVKQPKNEFTTHPRPMEQIFPNSLVIRNTISQQRFAKRRRCRFKGLSHSSAAKRSIASPKSKISDNSDRTSVAESDSIVKRENVSSKEEPMLLNDEVCLAEDEGLVPASSHNRVSVKREPIEDVVVVDSDDDLEQRYDHTATELPISVLATNPWTTTSGAYSSDACQDAGYTITTATGDESWQFSAASENDLMQAGYNEGVDDSYYDEAMYVAANVKQEPVDESVGPGHSNTGIQCGEATSVSSPRFRRHKNQNRFTTVGPYKQHEEEVNNKKATKNPIYRSSNDQTSQRFEEWSCMSLCGFQTDPDETEGMGFVGTDFTEFERVIRMEEKSRGCQVCKICGKQVKRLRDHMNVHFNIRPHSCDICGLAFSQLGTLYNHKKIHSATLLKCNVCGWKTTNDWSLSRHRQKHGIMQNL